MRQDKNLEGRNRTFVATRGKDFDKKAQRGRGFAKRGGVGLGHQENFKKRALRSADLDEGRRTLGTVEEIQLPRV